MLGNKSIQNFQYLFTEGFDPSWIPVTWALDRDNLRHASFKCKSSAAGFLTPTDKIMGDLGDLYGAFEEFCSFCFPSIIVGSMKVETWDKRIFEFRKYCEALKAPIGTLDQAIKLKQNMLTHSNSFQFNISGPYTSEVRAFFDARISELNQKVRSHLATMVFSTDIHQDLIYRLAYETLSHAHPFAHSLFPQEGGEHTQWLKKTASAMSKDTRWALFASSGYISTPYMKEHLWGAELAKELFVLADGLVLAPIGLVPSFLGARADLESGKRDIKILETIPNFSTVEAFNVLYHPDSEVYGSISAAWDAAQAFD